MREVDHRAKNILAVVQSVLRLTSRDEPRAFAAAARHAWPAGAGAFAPGRRRLVGRRLARRRRARLAPYSAVRGTDPARRCPSTGLVPLAPTAVQPLAMVLHELATNAAKHGALSARGGLVEVRWTVGRRKGEDGLLRLRWAEVGGPPVAGPPARRGFGTRVVEATVRGQLGGSVERRWGPGGLVVEVAVPVARVLAGAEAAKWAGAGMRTQASAA